MRRRMAEGLEAGLAAGEVWPCEVTVYLRARVGQ